VLVIQLVVRRILIHYLIHKTFAKKVAQFHIHVERKDCTHYHVTDIFKVDIFSLVLKQKC